MLQIDYYANNNRLKKLHPVEKVLFAISTMIIALSINSCLVQVIILTMMSFSIVLIAQIPLKYYLKLLSVPLVFIFISLISVILSISDNAADYIFFIKIGKFYMGAALGSILKAEVMFIRSLASISCMYFVILTTPFMDIIALLRKIRLPQVITELLTLVYRFIYVLIEAAASIFLSQASRLGYSGIKRSFKSLGMLIGMVFVKAYMQSQAIYTCMLSRCYNGTLNVIDTDYILNRRNLAVIVLIDIMLLLIFYAEVICIV